MSSRLGKIRDAGPLFSGSIPAGIAALGTGLSIEGFTVLFS
jgi:hypothetical protein